MKKIHIIKTPLLLAMLAVSASAQGPVPNYGLGPYSAANSVNGIPFRAYQVSGDGSTAYNGDSIWTEGEIFNFRNILQDRLDESIQSVSINKLSSDTKFTAGTYSRAIYEGEQFQRNEETGFIFNAEKDTIFTSAEYGFYDIADDGSSVLAYELNSEGSNRYWQSDEFNHRLVGREDANVYARYMDGAATVAAGSCGSYNGDIFTEQAASALVMLASPLVGYNGDIFTEQAAYWNLQDDGDSSDISAEYIAFLDTNIEPEGEQYITSQSSTKALSQNGRYILGNQYDGLYEDTYNEYGDGDGGYISRNQINSVSRTFLFERGEDGNFLKELFLPGNSSANDVSNNGLVVGSTGYGKFERVSSVDEGEAQIYGGFVYNSNTEETLSVRDWLIAGGSVVSEDIVFNSAESISNDGTVIVGYLERQRLVSLNDDEELISYQSYIARLGSGVIGTSQFNESLTVSAKPLRSVNNLSSLVLNGAHHVPLQMQGAGRYSWITADYAHNDEFDTDTALAEAGAAMDFMDKQLVAGLGAGQSWVDQGTALGGDTGISGQYLINELSYRANGTPYIFTLTSTTGQWDAKIARNYVNGGFIDTSTGNTNVDASAVRLRADWLSAIEAFGFGVSPKVEYTFSRTSLDGYTETGGGFPVVFNGISETSHQARYGFTAMRSVLQEKGFLRLRCEGVHRFDDGVTVSSGTITGISNFSIPGQSVKQNWLLCGVDFDYKLNDQITLTSGISSSTDGQDPTFGSTLGARISF